MSYPTTAADPTAVVGRRIGAWFIDLFLYLALVFGILFSTGGVDVDTVRYDSAATASEACENWGDATQQRICSATDNEVVFVEVEGFLGNSVWFAYVVGYIVLQGVTGGSPGKLAVGLRVVDATGKQAGLGKSALRTVMWVADAITFALPIVGGVMILSTKGHRRLGDMAASTYVVDKANVGQPPVPQLPAASSGAWGAPPAAGGWAPPPAPGSWEAPTPDLGAPPAPQTGDGPIWDEARDTYIQYDRERQAWVQWDTSTSAWVPISQ